MGPKNCFAFLSRRTRAQQRVIHSVSQCNQQPCTVSRSDRPHVDHTDHIVACVSLCQSTLSCPHSDKVAKGCVFQNGSRHEVLYYYNWGQSVSFLLEGNVNKRFKPHQVFFMDKRTPRPGCPGNLQRQTVSGVTRQHCLESK